MSSELGRSEILQKGRERARVELSGGYSNGVRVCQSEAAGGQR